MDRLSQNIELFKALSDETRLRLVVLLYKRELCVCQIEAALGISQTKASRHLSILRRAGLLRARRAGLWMYYTLEEPRNDLERCLFESLASAFGDELAAMVSRADAKKCNIQSVGSNSENTAALSIHCRQQQLRARDRCSGGRLRHSLTGGLCRGDRAAHRGAGIDWPGQRGSEAEGEVFCGG